MEVVTDRVHLNGRGSREVIERKCCPSGQEGKGKMERTVENVEAYGKNRCTLMLKQSKNQIKYT